MAARKGNTVLKPVYDFTPEGWTASLLNKAGAVIFVSRPHKKPTGAVKAVEAGAQWFRDYAAQNATGPSPKPKPKVKAQPAAPAPAPAPKRKGVVHTRGGNAAPPVAPPAAPEQVS